MKKVFQVEFKGEKQKYTFETKEQAVDFATIQAVFFGKKYTVAAIFVNEEAVK